MKKRLITFSVFATFLILACDHAAEHDTGKATPVEMSQEDLINRGKYLVGVLDCNICHTPKKMTPQGPLADETRLLSGHPADLALPKINKGEIEPGKWVLFNSDFTAAVGPWGISYGANLTPHASGIGDWTEEQFVRAIREGKHKGLADGRTLLPPMPWQAYSALPDEDFKAIFAFLKSIPPIDNVVPPAVPPTEL
jgi:hypothetical protein